MSSILNGNIPIRLLCTLLFTLISVPAFSQLPEFTLNVTHTEETCTGNAALGFTVQNTDPAATVTYNVYLLPNTTNAIAVLTTNALEGLTSGNYKIVATQVLNGETNSQTQNVTIVSQIVPLAYTISGTNVTCNNNGTMTVAVFSGTAALYEIISGPVIVPPQASPTFTNLAAGVYQVRVFDICGEGWVATHTLLSSVSSLNLNTATEETSLVTCDSIAITNSLTSALNASLSYPIDVAYTVFPPGGGAPIVSNIHLETGDVSTQEFTTVIPYYSTQQYASNISVTDACGNHFTFDNVEISHPFLGTVRATPAECGKYFLTYLFSNFLAPLTINFLSVPAGFNPTDFNADHPGPFGGPSFSYGDTEHGVPFGFYSAQVTDACGHVALIETTLEYIPPVPTPNVSPYPGCDSDKSEVKIGLVGYEFVSAIITAGPATFSSTYPVDVSASIDNEGKVILEFLPTGNYSITLVDDCGNVYDLTFIVPPLSTSVSSSTRTGCGNGEGSVRIRGNSTRLVSVIVTAAPAAYTATLPQNVSFNINADEPDVFSMNGFPAGTYVFKVTDNCTVEHTVTIQVVGYAVSENTYHVIPHCGSFDLEFSHTSNASTGETFWLQKWNPAISGWTHPETGVIYTEGTKPDSTNSYLISNHIINYNINYLGDFRIIKQYESFENGNVGLFKDCVEVIQTFTFNNALEITDIQKVTCNGLSSNVLITAKGFPPLTYQITSKNGLPFFVDNGSNNVFANLDSAVYNFLVFDTCGNIVNRLTDVALLPSLINIPQPLPGAIDLVHCDDGNIDGKSVFTLSDQNTRILGSLPVANYTITYHQTLEEATADVNPLPEAYLSGSATIFCRIEYLNRNDCYDIVSFNVTVNPYPMLEMETTRVICDGENVTLTADGGFLTYHWSTGQNTPEITVSQPGTYTLEVTQIENNLICTAIYTVEVVPSASATIHNIETVDWTVNDNSITVILDNPTQDDYSYSIDNIHFQSENTFYGLPTGIYTVYIKDKYGCKAVEQQVALLGYPKFFTPNKDGYNDYWQVFYASSEPDIKVYIFDRYGKFITEFGAASPGWDGTYDGRDLPSTDYWFKVIRQDGREHLGHFSMKR